MNPNISTISRYSKTGSVLAYLLTGRSLNRFEAASECRDTTLNSTISTLSNRYEINIRRKPELISGAHRRCRVMRYYLDASERHAIKNAICWVD